jgi:methylated-DNA-protein-cysteine methyltransferase-like protein
MHPPKSKSPTSALTRVAAIHRVVMSIPVGSVMTYGEVARRAGYLRSARLVAPALRQTPDVGMLPWHRVVAAGGRISFPVGSRLHAEQRRRLLSEGVRIHRGRVVTAGLADLDSLLWGGRD